MTRAAPNLVALSVAAVRWNYVGAIVKIVAQLGIQVALARMLGPEVYGQFAMTLVILGVGWLMADGGFGAALIQKKQIDDHEIAYALGWILLTSLISAFLIIAAAPWLAALVKAPGLTNVLRACAAFVPVQALGNLPLSLLRRNLNNRLVQVIGVGSYIAGFGLVGVALARHGCGVWSLVAAFAAQGLLSLTWAYLCVRHSLNVRIRGGSSLRAFGLNVVGVNLLNWCIESGDRFLIGTFWGLAPLGAYSVAFNLGRTPAGFLISSLQAVIFAAGSKVQDDTALIRRSALASLSITSLVAFPAFTVLALSAHFVITTMYGMKWGSAVPLFSAVAFSAPFYIVVAITGPFLWARGRVRAELRAQFATCVLLVAGITSVARYPLSEAVWVIPLVYLARALLMAWALARNVDIPGDSLWRAFRGGLVLSTLVLLLFQILDPASAGSRIRYAAYIAIAGASCISVLYFSRGWFLGTETRDLLLSYQQSSRVVRGALRAVGL